MVSFVPLSLSEIKWLALFNVASSVARRLAYSKLSHASHQIGMPLASIRNKSYTGLGMDTAYCTNYVRWELFHIAQVPVGYLNAQPHAPEMRAAAALA